MESAKKGQTSVELMVIMAATLVVIIFFFSISNESIADINQQKLVDEAQVSVDRLANAVNDVYFQGVGARKKVFYTVPTNVDENASGIESNSFVINVLGSDVFSSAEACVLGELPVSSGGHWVWITALEDCVYVGNENIELEVTSSYVVLSQDDSAEDSINISNTSGEDVNVYLSLSWAHSDVNLSLDTYSFTLAAGEDINVILTYASNNVASGNYTGTLYIDAGFSSGDENKTVPVAAEVVVPETDLVVLPGARSHALRAQQSDANNFQVCNLGTNDLNNLTFTSGGTIASWAAAIPSIPVLPTGTCETVDYNLTVPPGTSAGSYTGTITAADDAFNSDYIALTVNVSTSAQCFVFSWIGATIGAKAVSGWLVGNQCDYIISITHMTVYDWSNEDLDSAVVDKINIKGGTAAWSGSAGDGEEIDITDTPLDADTNYSGAVNKISFDQAINDDGEYFRVRFRFDDNSTYLTDYIYSEDNNAPIVTLVSPAAGATDADGDVNFAYFVSDDLSGVASCSLIIDGVIDQTDTNVTEDVNQYFWKTGLSNGNYSWDVNCTDNASPANTGSSDENRLLTVSAALDADEPVVNLESPASGYTDSDGGITFEYSVTDATSGIASCSFMWNGSVDQTDNSITEGVTQTFDKNGLIDGNYYWDVNCTDDSAQANLGGSREIRPVNVFIPSTTTIFWATVAASGGAFDNSASVPGTADNVYASTSNKQLGAENFDVTGLSGTISKVRIIWSHEIPGGLSNDTVDLSYGLTGYTQSTYKTYNSGNTPVDYMGTTSGEWEYYDATSNRPGGSSWAWVDFSNLKVGGSYNKSKGQDSSWRLDAVGVEITYK